MPRINNPGFVEALNIYVALSKLGPPDVINWDVGDIRANFPAGKLALGIDWGDVGPLSVDPKSGVVTGQVGSMHGTRRRQVLRQQDKQWVEKYNQAPFLAFGGWVASVSKTPRIRVRVRFCRFMGNQNMSRCW